MEEGHGGRVRREGLPRVFSFSKFKHFILMPSFIPVEKSV